MIPDWQDFYNESLLCHWNPITTLSKIEVSLLDVYGKEYTDETMLRLKIYITSINSTNNKEV